MFCKDCRFCIDRGIFYGQCQFSAFPRYLGDSFWAGSECDPDFFPVVDDMCLYQGDFLNELF